MKNYPIEKIKSDFPIFSEKINNNSLIYLDNAASAQKPNIVIDCESNFYRKEYASVHRGIHTLSTKATVRMEKIRIKIANFINAKSAEEIIFVKGTTEAINLISNSWGKHFFNFGDNIVITEMEHHANIVPWQILAKEKKLIIKFIPLLFNGRLDFSKLFTLIDKNTRLLSITQISNVLGTVNPISDLIFKIRNKIKNILIFIDGAQSIAHKKIDVQKLDCDFYAFSGHKIYGPSGIGVLYGKKKLLDKMYPWEGGGSMIKNVSLKNDSTTFTEVPWRFEAGTPNIAGIIGLGAAIDYVNNIGLDIIESYEYDLTKYALTILQQIPKIVIYGHSQGENIGVISFNFSKYHAYDIGTFLDQYGIAIRTGHHCAIPLMDFFHVSSMCRISLAIYNDKNDIDQLAIKLKRIKYLLES